MNAVARFCRAFLTVVIVAGLAIGSAAAADKKAKNEFPNAHRKDPKTELSPANRKKVTDAFDKLQDGKGAEVRNVFEELLNAKGSNKYTQALALQGLSQIEYEAENIDKAIQYNIQAIDLDALPNSAHFSQIYQTAQLYLGEEKYTEALAYVDRWIKETGAVKADAQALRGNCLYRLERHEEAAEAMKQAIAASDKPSDSWYQILLASYADAGKYDLAQQAADAALARDPNNKKILLLLSTVYMQAEKDDEALAVLERAYAKGLLTEPEELKQLYQLYNYKAQPEKAETVIDAGIAKGVLSPGLDMYKSLGDGYSQKADGADEATRKKVYAKAVSLYAKASPYAKDGEIDFLRAQLMIQELDQFAEGEKAMMAAISKGGLKREGEGWILVGNARAQLQNDSGAIAAYKKAATFPATQKMAEQWLKSMTANRGK